MKRARHAEAKASLVTVVIDADEVAWEEASASTPEDPLLLSNVLSNCVIFMNAIRAMSRDNEVALLASLPNGTAEWWADRQQGPRIAECVQTGLKRMIRAQKSWNGPSVPGLAVALSQALCRSNRALREHKLRSGLEAHARILVVQARPDQATQYIAAMNAAFAAQKCSILVDVADFTREGSKILQQVAHLSGGIMQHYNNTSSAAFMSHLLSVYLTDQEERRFVRLPPQAPIVLQAACFCHGQLCSRGYVCSVCVSVFCKDPKTSRATCPTCSTRILT